MADTKTADQWRQVASELTTKKAETLKQMDALGQQLIDNFKQRKILESQIANGKAGSAENRALIEQLNNLVDEKNKIQFEQRRLAEDVRGIDGQIASAFRQAEAAQDSPPGTAANPVTSSNTPPANPNPGNNTDVPPANDTQFALANAEPQTIDHNQDVTISDEEADMLELQREEAKAIAGPQPVPITEQEKEALLIANAEPQTISEPLNIRENAALLEANEGPAPGVGGDTTATTNPSQDSGTISARASGGNINETPFPAVPDWRVRLTLAPSAQYLYNIAGPKDILYPLKGKGVIFPYVPQISVSYHANYAPTDLPHSNYKIYNYINSSVEAIQITADFTAQDISEANYLLAVIHFFKSVTKMFYGNDSNPIRGMPPPLCYLSGHGEYGFDNHPVAIQTFSLTYPNDVDYINAGEASNVPLLPVYNPRGVTSSSSAARLSGSGLAAGGGAASKTGTQSAKNPGSTRVPTKIQLQITCLPIVTRNNISNKFSLKEYATGALLKGSTRAGGGIW
jgi:hypothetical protein